ncbi:Trimeric GatFAB AmidoTransferase(AdT) complex subunit [Modicella reniformis]|uniref:Trimeric GatFAB AmidoTransferase(AdT) complex subunit n=1 Tax=Modicella reniformis TaxID=1440133 RepID=A0A9P6IZW6_9FUNG|nr:Trimeric GatFAB AmidoTransferase(AdT) complex subunit [Modicella reniformis]
MKRPSTFALPEPKVRKQTSADEDKAISSKAKSTTPSGSKSVLKKSNSARDSLSSPKPKATLSGVALLKANTNANRSISVAAGQRGGKPKAVLKQPVMASKGDLTGGLGKKRRARVEKEDSSSDDDSGGENDGEDERESVDDDDDDNEDIEDEDDLEVVSAATSGVKKTSKKNTEESMAEAMSMILGSTLRKADASMPILARSRGVERKLEEEKMEAKARKAISNEKKRLANKDRVKPDFTGMEYEKKLRKVATRGVVQLFNAIKAQQKATEELTEKTRPITTNAKDKVASLTKASFLDLLKSGAKVTTVATFRSIFDESYTPISAATAALENISKYNMYLNAIVDIADPEAIRGQAKEAAHRWEIGKSKSPLDGAIMGYKMNFCTTDLRTTCASDMLRNFQAPYMATAIELLQEAGVIMGGKVNMDEFGMGSHNVFSNVGPVRNPHEIAGRAVETLNEIGCRSAGGSSGGSAAAVANIISKEDVKDSTCLTQRQRDTIAKSIKSIEPVAGQDLAATLSGVRIGIPQEFNIAELSPATKSLWRRGIQALKDSGATVIPVSLPNTKLAVGAYFTVGTAEASSNLQRYDGVRYGHQSEQQDEKDALFSHTRSEGFGKEVRRRILLGTYVLTSGSFDNFFLRAQKIRQMIRRDFDNIFARPNMITGSLAADNDIKKVHALLTPVAVTTAPKLADVVGDHIDPVNAYMDDILTIPASLAGLPAMSVPFGTCSNDGFPVGLQVMSQYGDEEMVFRVARVLEENMQ